MPVDLRLPVEKAFGPADVGFAQLRIILGQRAVLDPALAAGEREDFLGEFQDRDLAGVADVDRLVEVHEEQADDALDEIIDVTKAAGLRAVAVDRQRFAAQGLAHEIGQHTAVVQSHAWPVGIEDPNYVCIDVVRTMVRHDHRF